LLDQCSKPIEELRTRIKKTDVEVQTIVDSTDNLANFTYIQVEDDRLDDMEEVNRVEKTTR
jgi:hypothetical protein